MFVDIRDFTSFAEANSAEDTVARLNTLFEIVVPAVVEAGGHVNKFLGDGALAVFAAPNDLARHADAAVSVAASIQRLVDERFGGALRIGIGINTGVVIAGTIGGGGKLEFTLIGDTVNVAARIEQLTKTTGDTILMAQSCVDALTYRPHGLISRGSHALKVSRLRSRSSLSEQRHRRLPSPLQADLSAQSKSFVSDHQSMGGGFPGSFVRPAEMWQRQRPARPVPALASTATRRVVRAPNRLPQRFPRRRRSTARRYAPTRTTRRCRGSTRTSLLRARQIGRPDG